LLSRAVAHGSFPVGDSPTPPRHVEETSLRVQSGTSRSAAFGESGGTNGLGTRLWTADAWIGSSCAEKGGNRSAAPSLLHAETQSPKGGREKVCCGVVLAPEGGISALPIQAQPNPQGIAPILDGRPAAAVLWIAVPPLGEYPADGPPCSESSSCADHSLAQRFQGENIRADALGTERAGAEIFCLPDELRGG